MATEPINEPAVEAGLPELNEDRRPGDVRLAPVHAALEREGLTTLSLDVFDTILWRKVAAPVDAFPLIGERLAERGRLAPDITPELFGELRERAEKAARERVRARDGAVEVTLDQIYAELPGLIFAGDPEHGELVETELETERGLLVPDLDVVALIHTARERGLDVVAVSDTYFSEEHLRSFLSRAPLSAQDIDRVFCSSAHGTGKGGGLFSIVLRELDRRPDQVVHLGDNHEADVVAPRRLGIETHYFERQPPALERALKRERADVRAPARPGHGDFGLAGIRGKVTHRVSVAGQPETLAPFAQIGASHLGPVFAGFAEWVHHRATERGASRAFCLMREGELLAGLVNGAAAYLGPELVAEPMWLSRQVVARASIYEGTPEELSALLVRRSLPTLREFCRTLGLEVSDLPALAHRADARLDDHALGDAVISAIAWNPELRARVVAGSQTLRQRVLRYVRSLIPAGEETVVVVDLGWGATIQRLLQRLLDEDDAGVRTLGLYLLTRDQAAEHVLGGLDAHGFLASMGEPDPAVSSLMRSPEILEQVCMPDHGSQIDLSSDLKPVLAAADDFLYQSVERRAVQEGILAFQAEWARYHREVPDALTPLWDGAQEALLAILLRTIVSPSADEASLFSSWLHDENFGSEGVETIVSGDAVKAVRYLEPEALMAIPMDELYWPFALASLHDPRLRAATGAAAAGLVPWDTFSSALETGPFEVYVDRGWGFTEDNKLSFEVRRNRFGLSYARATLRDDFVQRIRLDPAEEPCVVRVDWIELRCRVHDATEPVTIRIDGAQEIGRLSFAGGRRVAPNVLVVSGRDPQIVLDVEQEVGARVYEVRMSCGFAVLPLPPSRALARRDRARGGLKRLAKESPAGYPVRLARRVVKRLGR